MENKSSLKIGKSDMRILIFGDSITQGFHDAECGGWANRLAIFGIQKSIETDFQEGFDVMNLGISGDCTNRLAKRFDAEAEVRTKGQKHDTVIIFAVGVNDTQRYVATGEIKTPVEQFVNNIRTLQEKARAVADIVVFVGLAPIVEDKVNPMPWADDRGHASADVQVYDDLIKNVCLETECLYIPMCDVFGDAENVINIFEDGIHPNTYGHQLMYEQVQSMLSEDNII